MSNDRGRVTKLRWVYISGFVFVISLAVSVLLIVYAEQLSQFGITKSFYYILLIPAGLCAAAFLFGAMHSHAKYVGKNSYGQLELTGPVVVFALVVIGGFYFAEPESTFLLTVRLSAENNQIIEKGSVILDLGSQRMKRNIGENGEVIFAELPSKFIGNKVKIIPQVEGYSVKNSVMKIPPDKVLNLELVPESYNTEVRGTVIDRNGNPLKGVSINFESGLALGESNEAGNFFITVPYKAGTSLLVTASYNGKVGYRDYLAIPVSGSVTIPFNTGE
jgi:hypothetical protein